MLVEAFKQSELLNLADAFEKELVVTSGTRVDKQSWQAEIRGLLNLSHNDFQSDIQPACRFVISYDWSIRLPEVYCDAHWIRKARDWHAGKNGYLCYELPKRWHDYIGNVIQKNGRATAARYAAAWCMHSTRWLLFRHRFAYENNITEWPKAWPAWAHDEKGVTEYIQQRLKRNR